MKILYHHRIGSKDGQYVHIEELTSALKELGHEIVVVGPAAVETETFGGEAGFVALLKKYLPRFVYELLEFAYAFGDYLRLAKAVKTHKPDCLYERYNLYLPSGIWVKRRFRLPMLLEVNAPLYEERKRYSGLALDRLARWTERTTWCGADFVLPVTHVLARRMMDAGVEESKVIVIPNGIDPERFSRGRDREEAKRALGLQGRLVLGFVGFMREWHGLERVVELIADDPDDKRHLLLVGDGPARTPLEGLARSLGVADRVTITGVVDRGGVASYVEAFDIALQPQVVEYASPLKLFEYLALGRPIVAPATPNIREVLVHEQNAILFQPGDEAGFRAGIDRLCRDAALRERIGAAAAATIERRGLTWRTNALRVTDLYRRLGVVDRSTLAEASNDSARASLQRHSGASGAGARD